MKIVIEVNEETQQVGMTCDKSVRIDDLMTVFFTLQLSVLKQATPSEDDPHFEQIRDLLYDNYNNGASHVLSLYAPDNTLRPDLTEEAMLHTEDAYMKQMVDKYYQKPKLEVLKGPKEPEHVEEGNVDAT